MAKVTSNIDQVERLIRELADLIDFTRPGIEGTVGDDCLDAAIGVMQDRSINEQAGADGAPWPDNSDAYKKRPDKAGRPVGVLTGDMLSDVQMRGTRVVEPEFAAARYGVSDDAAEKASWFHKGGYGEGDGPAAANPNQPPRPNMYALDDRACDAVQDVIADFVGRRMAQLGG